MFQQVADLLKQYQPQSPAIHRAAQQSCINKYLWALALHTCPAEGGAGSPHADFVHDP